MATEAPGARSRSQRPPGRQPALRITIGAGIGEGPTALGAFDAALVDAGVANYNLIGLSSVIPPRATLARERHDASAADYGRRLYVVMSQMREERPGHVAHAGIGWIQDPATGRGLFVEMHGGDRQRLLRDLHATLDAMRTARPIDYGPVQTEIASAPCVERPVCALVAAVYACEPW
jgi:arginine decarboxylase